MTRTPRRNPPGWTTLVGLGAAHQAERRKALAELRPGVDRCPFAYCGHAPLYLWQQLDLDHYPPRIFGRPGIKRLSHARCNRKAGAMLGVAIRRAHLKGRRSGTVPPGSEQPQGPSPRW